MLGSNFALLVKSPGDDGQQQLTTVSRLGMYIVGGKPFIWQVYNFYHFNISKCLGV